MIISHKHKFIFFANGKCASSTIENALWKYNDDDRISIIDIYGGKKGIWSKMTLDNGVNVSGLWGKNTEHVPPQLCHQELGEVFSSYYKFGFVRNPKSWIASNYIHNFNHKPEIFESHHIVKIFDFLKYFRRGINSISKFQFAFFSDSKFKNLLVDHVGKVETLNSDLEFISQNIKLDISIGVSTNQNQFNESEYKFSNHAIDLLKVLYKKDLNYFNYKI